MIERTLSLIKPDAVQRNLTGEILAMIQGAGLKVVALKMIHMTKAQAEGFYAVHRERPFFDSLTDYMSSGAVSMKLPTTKKQAGALCFLSASRIAGVQPFS